MLYATVCILVDFVIACLRGKIRYEKLEREFKHILGEAGVCNVSIKVELCSFVRTAIRVVFIGKRFQGFGSVGRRKSCNSCKVFDKNIAKIQ